MKKTLPLNPPPPRNPPDEQYIFNSIRNPSLRFLAEISLILCISLSNDTHQGSNCDFRSQIWRNRPQIPDFARTTDGERRHLLTNASFVSEATIAATHHFLRNQIKLQRISVCKEPRLNWRLGILRFLYCSLLFFLKILGVNSLSGGGKLSKAILNRKDYWGETSTPLRRGYVRPRSMANPRLYLSFPKSKLFKSRICICAWLKYDSKLRNDVLQSFFHIFLFLPLHNLYSQILCICILFVWILKVFFLRRLQANMEKENRPYKKVLCTDTSFSKEQFSKDTSKDNDENFATKVIETFKGSSFKKPTEACTSGTKKEKGKTIAKIGMVAFLGNHMRNLEISTLRLKNTMQLYHVSITCLRNSLIGSRIPICRRYLPMTRARLTSLKDTWCISSSIYFECRWCSSSSFCLKMNKGRRSIQALFHHHCRLSIFIWLISTGAD